MWGCPVLDGCRRKPCPERSGRQQLAGRQPSGGPEWLPEACLNRRLPSLAKAYTKEHAKTVICCHRGMAGMRQRKMRMGEKEEGFSISVYKTYKICYVLSLRMRFLQRHMGGHTFTWADTWCADLAWATAERCDDGVMALKADRKSLRDTHTVAGSTSSLSLVS